MPGLLRFYSGALFSLKPSLSLKDLVTLGDHFRSVEDWNECALWLDTALRKWSELFPDKLNHSIMFSAQECFTNIGQFGYARYLGWFFIAEIIQSLVSIVAETI